MIALLLACGSTEPPLPTWSDRCASLEERANAAEENLDRGWLEPADPLVPLVGELSVRVRVRAPWPEPADGPLLAITLDPLSMAGARLAPDALPEGLRRTLRGRPLKWVGLLPAAATPWSDVLAAVRTAYDAGAEHVVLPSCRGAPRWRDTPEQAPRTPFRAPTVDADGYPLLRPLFGALPCVSCPDLPVLDSKQPRDPGECSVRVAIDHDGAPLRIVPDPRCSPAQVETAASLSGARWTPPRTAEDSPARALLTLRLGPVAAP